jgi:hypothetical protein
MPVSTCGISQWPTLQPTHLSELLEVELLCMKAAVLARPEDGVVEVVRRPLR